MHILINLILINCLDQNKMVNRSNIHRQLAVAIDENDTEEAVRLINKNAKINREGGKYLITAMENNNTVIAELLIKRGIRLDSQKLIYACKNRFFDIAKMIIKKGIILDENIVKYICRDPECESDIINFLIENCPDINLNYHAMVNLIECENIEGIACFLEKGFDVNIHAEYCDSLLVIASSYLNYDHTRLSIIKMLLEYGADIHHKKEMPLYRACYYGNYDIAKYLLENGAIATVNPKCIQQPVADGNIELVKLLMEYGADIRYKNDKPLYIACSFRHFDMVEFLISKGADPSSKSRKFLLCALGSNNRRIIEIMRNNGMDIDSTDRNLLVTTAKKYCINSIKYLLDIGCKPDIDLICDNISDENIENYDIRKNDYLFNSDDLFDYDDSFEEKSVESIHNNLEDDQIDIDEVKMEKNIEILEIFLENGFDVRTDENRALKVACEKDNTEAIALLLRYGADYNLVTNVDENLLDMFYEDEHIYHLLKHKIDNQFNDDMSNCFSS